MGDITLLNYVCDVSSAISKHASGYTSTQGYTVGADNSQVVVAIDTDKKLSDGKLDPNNGCVLKFSNSGQYSTAKKGKNLGHGNGCTYYNGYYYIVKGGGSSGSARILRYTKDFTYDKKYDCVNGNNKTQNVSSITHMTGDYFILASGGKAFVCKKYDAGNGTSVGQFKIFSSLDISDTKITNAFNSGNNSYTLVSQSVYYDKGEKKLYRVVSYRDGNGAIKRNAIAKFTLSNNAPSYTTATLNNVYKNTRTDISLFEIEAMSSDSNGRKYISTNAAYDGNKQCDAVFQIGLS